MTAAARLNPQERVRSALGGAVPAAIAVPIITSYWAPLWFSLAWAGLYIAISAVSMSIAWRRPSHRLEFWWAIATSTCFALLPASAAIWDNGQTFWITGMIATVYIAFELAYLPFADVGEWRVGIVILGAAVTICGVLTINPIAALAYPPIIFVMVSTAERLRTARAALDHQLEHAEHELGQDPLTGLLNRRGLAEILARRDGQPTSLLLIDLDDFKLVNDTRGYSVGDQVLREVADELRGRLGDDWQLGRQGGDEFVAVSARIDHDLAALDAALRVPLTCRILTHGFHDEIEVALSAGVVHSTSSSADDLMGRATYALRASKHGDRALTNFGDQLEERFARARQIASMGSNDDHGGTFVAHGQPIHGANGAVGCELLVRWQTADGDLVAPGDFLPMAAETGTLPLLHRMMLAAGVEFAARFNGLRDTPFVSVNVSASHLAAEDLLAELRSLLRRHDVAPERMMIEITESERLADLDHGTMILDQLRKLGVQLAIDDFGTGYSGIERLQSLPITHLKFDRSLLAKADGPLGEILRGVTRFGARAGIEVIAEGIETADELASMRALGVSAFQGFLFGRPMTLDALERHLRRPRVDSHPASDTAPAVEQPGLRIVR